jgi:hypothetical protein
VLCCIIGIFVLSLLVVTILIFTILSQDEDKAYKHIDHLFRKTLKNNYINNYFDTYIKYKMLNQRKKSSLEDYFIKKNKYKEMRAQHLLKIKAMCKKPFDLNSFCKNSRNIWDDDSYEIKEKIAEETEKIFPKIDDFNDISFKVLGDAKTSKLSSFKMCNLIRIMSTIGNTFQINCNCYILIAFSNK